MFSHIISHDREVFGIMLLMTALKGDSEKEPKILAPDVERIKKIIEFNHGFVPDEQDILRVDRMLRNQYGVLHDQCIIRELVTERIDDILLAHGQEKPDIESLFLDKSIFHYLTFASMSFRAGIPLGCIALCRTALEAGLRERLAEGKAASPEEVWVGIRERSETLLGDLMKEAEREGTLSKKQIQEAFEFAGQFGHHVLDKYIHADLNSIINLLGGLGLDIRVVGAKDKLAEKKIQAGAYIDLIAAIILAATTKIAEMLYLVPN